MLSRESRISSGLRALMCQKRSVGNALMNRVAKQHRLSRTDSPRGRVLRDHAFNPLCVVAHAYIAANLAIAAWGPDCTLRIYP